MHYSDNEWSFFKIINISHSNNYDPNGPNRKKVRFSY